VHRLARACLVFGVAALCGGCAGVNSVLFVTTTSLGIDFDTKPPTASIGYDRVEGYLGPRYDNGAVPPVIARIRTDGGIFTPHVRQVYATGAAAALLTDKDSTTKGPVDLTGGKRLMLFGTTTTTGVKITFDGQYPDSFHFGFKRKEFSLIPLGEAAAGNKIVDVYPSVLATLDNGVRAVGGPADVGLQFGQVFATGVAAEAMAKDTAIQELFKTEVKDAFAAYRDATREQQVVSAAVLRCYIGVREADLPDVWNDANTHGLLRDPGTLAQLKAWHAAATAAGATAQVKEDNLRRASRQYASDIAIVDGATPTRLDSLKAHRTKVCEAARK